jgi:indolepyruvate ferredoxin oxidoreductase beta subunit
MNDNMKILVTGVGGQGIVFLTNIIAEAAMVQGIPVAVSEIHGLSQRGGMVTAGIGLGKYSTGFYGRGGVDFLIGLEAMETIRCLTWLHPQSTVVFGDYRMPTQAVNEENAQYPDVPEFAGYLQKNVACTVFVPKFPVGMRTVLYNAFLLGAALKTGKLPFTTEATETAIKNKAQNHALKSTLDALHQGLSYNK